MCTSIGKIANIRSFVYRFVAVLVLFSVTHLKATAQYNDSVFHYTGIFSTGSLNRTNTTSAYLLNNVVKTGFKRKNTALNVSASWTYGEQNNVLSNNDVSASGQADFNSSVKRLYYCGLAGYLSGYSLKINNQYQAGAGMAYDLFDVEKVKFNISEGLLYESNDIKLSDTANNKYTTLRNSIRLQYNGKIIDRVSVTSSFFYQNSFNNGADYIVRASVNIVIKVRRWLNFTTSYAYNRVNITAKENTLFTYGINFERYY